MVEILLKEETYRIQGAVFEVYRQMGCGFLEAVYHECLEVEFRLQNIPFLSEANLPVSYKGKTLKQKYKPDFVCFGKIIVEIKAIASLAGEHDAQVINYLRISGHRVGLLINFGAYPKAIVKRLVL